MALKIKNNNNNNKVKKHKNNTLSTFYTSLRFIDDIMSILFENICNTAGIIIALIVMVSGGQKK